MKTKLRIDYERASILHFKLVAYDSGVPQLSSTADVTVNIININDMDPVFDQVLNPSNRVSLSSKLLKILACSNLVMRFLFCKPIE